MTGILPGGPPDLRMRSADLHFDVDRFPSTAIILAIPDGHELQEFKYHILLEALGPSGFAT